MTSIFPIGAVPIASYIVPFAKPYATYIAPAVIDDAAHLIEINAYTGSTVGTVLRPDVIGATPVAGFPLGSEIPSAEITLRYGDRTWIGEPSDPDQPNKLYLGRALTPLQFERDAPILPEQNRRLQVQYGQIVLANGDGELDAALSGYRVAGRTVRVLRGSPGTVVSPFILGSSSLGGSDQLGGGRVSTLYSDFAVVLSGLATDWEQDEDRVTVSLRDTAYKLELPLQSTLYAGTGGAEGDSQWTGKPKPICLGVKRNIAPDAIDAANNVYCYHYRQANAVTAARDQGVALTIDGDDADYATLVAAVIAGGHARTCLAKGLIRTQTTPVALTVDVHGDAVGGYVNTHAGLARRVLGGIMALTNGEYDYGSFGSWPAGTAGIYFDSSQAITAAAAMDLIAGSVAGWWGPRRDGTIAGGTMPDPAASNPDLYVTLADLRAPLQTVAPPSIPRYRQRVGYEALQVTQADANLAGAVSASDRLFYGEPYRSVTSIDTDVQTIYPFAVDPPVLVSLFDGSADAQTLADTILGLHKHTRRIFRAALGPLGFYLDLGFVVNVTYPRFGLEGGQNFVVVGLAEDAAGVTATLWG